MSLRPAAIYRRKIKCRAKMFRAILFFSLFSTTSFRAEIPKPSSKAATQSAFAWGTRLPESLTARAAELSKVRGRRRVKHLSLGKTELTVLPRDMFTDLYPATATLWKVEVTASNV